VGLAGEVAGGGDVSKGEEGGGLAAVGALDLAGGFHLLADFFGGGADLIEDFVARGFGGVGEELGADEAGETQRRYGELAQDEGDLLRDAGVGVDVDEALHVGAEVGDVGVEVGGSGRGFDCGTLRIEAVFAGVLVAKRGTTEID
jgi:hypothetical protein